MLRVPKVEVMERFNCQCVHSAVHSKCSFVCVYRTVLYSTILKVSRGHDTRANISKQSPPRSLIEQQEEVACE